MPVSTATTAAKTTIELFTNGNLDASSPLTFGDLIGTLAVGTIAWMLIVGMFLIGVLKSTEFYYSGKKQALISGITPIKLLIKPLSFLIIGVILLSFIVVILKYTYDVDFQNILKFFFEARYDNLVGNLSVSPKNLGLAKTLLMVLDLGSKIAVYSIPMINLIIYILFFTYFIAVFSYEKGIGGQNTPVFKVMANAFMTLIVTLMLVTIFNKSINAYLFINRPTVPPFGTISTCSGLNKAIIKYWVKKAYS